MLEVKSVTIGYGSTDVVHEVSLTLARGEIGCLLGPSGCGKTSLLRAIGGFEPLRAGCIGINGKTVSTPRLQLPPRDRGIGMVFQEHALFPHLSVHGNVAFGLRKLPPSERDNRVEDMLELVGLVGLQHRWPHELSGGQQQRVALARALAPGPSLLLLDEPFSNLDTSLRVSIAREIREILRQARATALMVTHDQHEAFAIADSIGVMVNGNLRQWDTPFAVYRRPATPDVAKLIGEGRLLVSHERSDRHVRTEGGLTIYDAPVYQSEEDLLVLVRPEDLRLDFESQLMGTIIERVFRGSHFLYAVKISNEQVLVQGGIDRPYEIGAAVGIRHRERSSI